MALSAPAVLALSLGAALVATPPAARLASAVGLVDRPGPLKVHRSPTPCAGGMAVGAALAVSLGAAGQWAALGPLACALTVGVLDDRFGVPARWRLVVQAGVGVLVAVVFPVRAGVLGAAVVVAGTVAVVNAVNLVDGIDGLASASAAVVAGGLGWLAAGAARAQAAAVAGAALAFLAYNRPPARAFLGDGGSYLLGAALAELCVRAWAPGRPWPAGLASVMVLAYPLVEVGAAVARRWTSGRRLTEGDRDHLYDRMVGRGWPVATTVAWLAGAQAALGLLAGALALAGGRAVAAGSAALALAATLVCVGSARGAPPAGRGAG
ncbi:MAG TPA: hypothetical protein VKY15_02725 [Acidimicrobiales bacterium]|jgi:UDP-GlcNAc:undecaprenyl-phosphate GlcNAc-1-phosphate transferase|nr:hypothetical protein [Acidimicrobiales bacterium]